MSEFSFRFNEMNCRQQHGPFFSILTASYDSASSIGRTIESVKNQTFMHTQHIVIDGESRDGTQAILSSHESAYNLRWLSEPDDGISDALNKGLAFSEGRYFLVLHADDRLLSPDVLERVYNVIKDERYDIYAFPIILDHHDRGKVLCKPKRLMWWNRFKTIFMHQGSFVHRRVYEQVGGFRKELSIALDYDFFYRALAAGCSVRFEQFPVSLMAGGGISNNPNFLHKRLKEEEVVQSINERNPVWGLAQRVFRVLYIPYKTRSIKRQLE